ncbi:MAG: type II toxin-antitoxin system ParD family antitoxin [Myxococcales bacterium]|nr:type II toxin-antitoxin system ParD family antitoxin [Myxococcales bacterium]
MGMVKKSITVTDQQEAWIQAQIGQGHYASDSEVIREALREKQQRTAELEAIRAALQEGEDSGLSSRTIDDIRRAVLARRGLIGADPTDERS